MVRSTKMAMKMFPAMTRTQSLKSAPVGTLLLASGAASGTTLAASSCVIIAVSPLLPRSSDGSHLPSLCSVRGDSTPQRERVGLVQGGVPRPVPGDGRGGPPFVVVARVDLPVLELAELHRAVQTANRRT